MKESISPSVTLQATHISHRLQQPRASNYGTIQKFQIASTELFITGGWVVDPQFLDIMGSPYLLAHGLGITVKDAKTEVNIPKAANYKVWVHTKHWVAKWDVPGTPGRFQILINEKPLETTFGTVGKQWHWQESGNIELPQVNFLTARSQRLRGTMPIGDTEQYPERHHFDLLGDGLR